MTDFVMPLLLDLDVSSLTMSLVNIASPTGFETALADSVEAALRPLAHLDVRRVGDTVVARTEVGHPDRVVVAGRLGTSAVADDPVAYVEMGRLFGPGARDAKGALAVMLKVAAAGGYSRDVTFVFGDPVMTDGPRGDFTLVAAPTGSAVVGDALDHPWAQQLIALTDAAPEAGRELRFSIGGPAVAFGPGDPSFEASPEEFVPTAHLTQCEFVLRQWLTR